MNEVIQTEVTHFFEAVPATRLKQNIRRLLIFFIRARRGEGLPDFMNDCLVDCMLFFELLDIIDEEAQSP